MARIRTPDQRLRVFVSSTLGELRPEREAVRDAIQQLHLTPVMFELGARPHPPRELYRAYLEQSQVFLGMYWQRYGWIAPGEEISGLEDEYRRAGDRPRLLYVKGPAPERDARLEELIADFQRDDRASYRHFTTTAELVRLVADDVALLLSERFEPDDVGVGATGELCGDAGPPAPLTSIVGRDRDLVDVAEMLQTSRLVTITGLGGVGKTRLAVEVARTVGSDFPDGVVFVPLADITDVARAMREIADRIGARIEAGDADTAVAAQLRDRRVLLVLDNAEQVDGLAAAVVALLERLPTVRALVTSRRALHVRGEARYPLDPLPLPPPGATTDVLGEEPALQLFVDRATAVRPDFRLRPADAVLLAELVRRVDGLPLAIELAAARTRLMGLPALVEGLGSSLDVPGTPGADVPERQRTLRATLDWSHDLLSPEERELAARLSVFAGSFTLDAAVAVGDGPHPDEVLAGLLDASLVTSAPALERSEPRFETLGMVHAYAAEQLQHRGEEAELRRRHLDWYRRLAELAQPYLCGPGQQEWVVRMHPERANLAAAVDTALVEADIEAVVEIAWDVVVLYFVTDAVTEPDSWLRRAVESGRALDPVTDAKLRSLYALTRIHHGDFQGAPAALRSAEAVFRAEGMDFERAVVLHQLGFVRYSLEQDVEGAVAALEESNALFDEIGHDWGVGLVQAMLGSLFAATGDLERAERCQVRSLERARAIASDQQVVQALGQLALVRLLQERYDEALHFVAEAAPVLRRGGFRADTANALDVLAVVAHVRGSEATASTAVAVAAHERVVLSVEPWPTIRPFIERIRGWVRDALGDEAFAELERTAAERDLFETFDATLADAAESSTP